MKILTAPELRALDELTITEQRLTSTDLMDRAAAAFANSFMERFGNAKQLPVLILCGSGNNGGDGLVAARILSSAGYHVHVIAVFGNSVSSDFEYQWKQAWRGQYRRDVLELGAKLPTPAQGIILIDALFGTGLSRPLEGHYAELVRHFNRHDIQRVALDVPSGLMVDQPTTGPALHADVTFTIGNPKAALFAPENSRYVGELVITTFPQADPDSVASARPEGNLPSELVTPDSLRHLLRQRRANSHKGTFGHALLVAGSFGKMGAAVIAGRAVLRSGAGLLTCHVPRSGYEIMQISFPEAMCTVDAHRYHTTEIGELGSYETIGVGPGLGTKNLTAKALRKLLTEFDRPMVVDADALNIIAEEPELLTLIPKKSILTPHPKEFQRLFGKTEDSFARWRVLGTQAKSHELIILVKTAFTSIGGPGGTIYINPTGNPGMGTAGTGDALTGILTGLLAQGYEPLDAARLGVYLHGLAGDIAAEEMTQEFLLAEDVVNHLGAAYQQLRTR